MGLLFLSGPARADVTIDSSVSSTSSVHNGSSPTVVFTSDEEGYAFYRDSSGSCVYRKTSDGGDSWGSAVTVDSQTDCIGIAVWYDQWISSDDDEEDIHLVTWDTGSDDLFYTRLDTSDDSLTTTVNASGSGQGGSFTSGANFAGITRGTDGVLYIGIQDNGDSFVLKCSANCNTASNWSEAGSNPFDTADDYLILMPLSGGDILAIRWDISANDIDSKVYDSSSDTWDSGWTDIDTDASENSTYDAAFGATLDKTTGDIYLAYAADVQSLGSDDDIRTAVYDGSVWSAKADVLTDDSRGVTGVKIGFDDNTGDIYVLYTARTTSSSSSTGNVYTRVSSDGMDSWDSESAALNTTAGDLYGARLNLLSDEHLYVSWIAGDDLFGATVADLTPPTVSFSSASSGGSEATTPASFTVTLSSVSIHDVTVDYTVADGTANGEGIDYTLADGTVTIAAGDTSVAIGFTVNDDGIDESDETFTVNLTGAGHADLGDTISHVYTIQDDDTAGVTIAESGGSTDVVEGGATDSYTIVLDTEPTSDVTVTLSHGSQISLSSETLTFTSSDWNSAQAVTVTAVDDAIYEGNHTGAVSHAVSSPDPNYDNLSLSDVTANITDDESAPLLAVSDGSVGEGAGLATVTVTMTGTSAGTVTVDYATSNGSAVSGSDYTSAAGTLRWTSGETGAKTFTVPITDDSLDESDETITITLSNASGSTISDASGVVTITDNDTEETDDGGEETEGGEETGDSPEETGSTDGETEEGETGNEEEEAGSDVELTANAGADRTVVAGATLTLDGSGSTGAVRYLWSVKSGVGVLEDEEGSVSALSIPSFIETQDVVVGLLVENDAGESQTDTVVFHVMALTASGDALEEPLVGILNGTPFYEEITFTGDDEPRITLVFGSASIQLPSEAEEYYLTITDDRYLIIGVPLASDAGRVYFSTQPVENLEGEMDLEVVPGSALASADFIGAVPAISPSVGDGDSGFVKVTGQVSGDLFGKYLAVGDLDHDGVDEIIVGAPNASSNGSVFIYSEDVSGATSFVLTSIVEGSGELPLHSILLADFLGDAADDIFFGPDNVGLNPVLRRNNFSSSLAAATDGFMVMGGEIADGSVSAASSVVETVVENTGDQLFTSAVFGDVNGDGEADLILTTDGGEVLVYFGKQESISVLTDSDADVVISGGGAATGGDTGFGTMVAAGDVTGDGIADIVVGAPLAAGERGGIYVIFGRLEWEDSMNLEDDFSAILFTGEEEGDSIGSDLLVEDGDDDGVSEIYTIKGESTVYRISWSGESALGGEGGGGGGSRLGPGGFGCSLEGTTSLRGGGEGVMILLACFFAGLFLSLRFFKMHPDHRL